MRRSGKRNGQLLRNLIIVDMTELAPSFSSSIPAVIYSRRRLRRLHRLQTIRPLSY
jgi:hypothetical protein